jgi:hypothetical protein
MEEFGGFGSCARACGVDRRRVMEDCYDYSEDPKFEFVSRPSGRRHGKEVVCLDDGKMYFDVVAASRETVISRKKIYAACRGIASDAGGRRFTYSNE